MATHQLTQSGSLHKIGDRSSSCDQMVVEALMMLVGWRTPRTLWTTAFGSLFVLWLLFPDSVAHAQFTDPMTMDRGTASTSGDSSGGGTLLPDLFTGSMSYTLPIAVAPGRNGLAPSLAITYRSSNRTGWLGVGWDLEVGAIERDTRFGLDYNSDKFIFRMAGSTVDLVYVGDDASGNREYRAKIEGAFTRVKKIGDYWEATDKTGRRSLFGQMPGSRLDGAPGTFRWYFDQVIDPNGNYLLLSYLPKDQGQLYLDRIDYTYPGPNSYVKFYWESRTDAPVMYTSNFAVTTAKRLRTIDVVANSGRVRAYKIGYTPSASTAGRSLLSTIQQFGKDATLDSEGRITNEATASKLPAQTFAYTSGGTGFDNAVSGPPFYIGNIDNTTAAIANNLSGVKFGDFNGDGRLDMVIVQGDNNSTVPMKIYLANADGTFPSTPINGPSHSFGSGDAERANDIAGVKLGDFNGDGRTDLLVVRGPRNGSETMKIYLANADGTYPSTPIDGPSHSFGNGDAERANDIAGVKLGDFDGNGRTDLLVVRGPRNGSETMKIYLANVDGTFPTTPLTGPTYAFGYSDDERANDIAALKLADVNGDRRVDLVAIQRVKGSSVPMLIYLANTDGTFPTTPLTTGPSYYYGNSDEIDVRIAMNIAGVKFGDFNGDGRTDILTMQGDNNTTVPIKIYFSKGDGSFDAAVNGPSHSFGNGDAERINDVARVNVGDFNGDGKSDLHVIPVVRGSTSQILIYLGNFGDAAFTGPYNGPSHGGGYSDEEIGLDLMRMRVGDFNGDGMGDLVVMAMAKGVSTPMSVYRSAGQFPDLLVEVLNGLDGQTRLTYAPSTQSGTNPQLPFAVQTLTSVETCDNYSFIIGVCLDQTPSVTSYSYSGGYYYIPERDFRGFNYVKVTAPVGPNGEQTFAETWFHQGSDTAVDLNNPSVADGYMKGKTYRSRTSGVLNGATGVYAERTTTYQADGTAPYFNPPSQVDAWTCDGDACGKQTRTSYAYDSYGNVTREHQEGEVGPSSDDRTVERSFSYNTTDWLVGLPATEAIYEGLGTAGPKKAETSFYYDGASYFTTPPIKGNVTGIFSGLDDSTDTGMEYDSFGNLTSVYDARGNPTGTCYDATGTFPQRVRNALNQDAKTDYYGVSWNTACGTAPAAFTGSGLYGQVKTVTGPNNTQTQTEFDPLGRITRVTRPDGSWTSTVYISFGGGVGTQHVRTDSAAGLSAWTYFDGLGRTFLEKRTGPDSTLIATQTQYDVRGAVRQTSLPYFDGTESPAGRWAVVSYDPMGRVVRRDFPDGTRTLSCSNDWVTVGIDANNHRKREVRDAYGRLVTVNEYSGTYTSCTTDLGSPYATTQYTYDVMGNLRFVTDAKNNQTEMQYDSLGRKTFMHDPDTGDWTYQYDKAGNLLRQTDAKGQTIDFTYDALNRVVTRTADAPPVISSVAAGSVTASEATITWTTDEAADTQVEYGTTTAYGSSSPLDTTLVTSHSVALSGLTASTLYHYRVKSRDARGELATSGDFTFTSSPIAVDAVSTTIGNASSFTWSHTVTGTNRLLVVGVSYRTSGSVAGVTYAGQALSPIGTATQTNVGVSLWALVNPPTGTNSVVVTMSAQAKAVSAAVSYTGVHQTTPVGSFVSAVGNSTSPSVTVSSAGGELVVDVVGAQGTDTATAGPGQTQRWNTVTTGNSTNSNVRGVGSSEAGASTVPMSWTLGAAQFWAAGAVPLKPAP